MKKVLLAVVMFVIVFATVPVFAEMPTFLKNSYVALRAGAFSPNSDDNGLKDFDTGYNVEVAYGYKIMPNFAVEGGIGKYSSGYEQDQISGKATATASAIPITATAKGVLPLADGKFELYGGAGLGLYLSTLETELAGSSESYDTNAFGFHIVGGADYNLSKSIAIGGEAKWISVEPDFGSSGGSGKMGGLVVNAGLKYKF